MLVCFNTDTQYAHFRGNPVYQATKQHLNNRKTMKNEKKNVQLCACVLFYFDFGVD